MNIEPRRKPYCLDSLRRCLIPGFNQSAPRINPESTPPERRATASPGSKALFERDRRLNRPAIAEDVSTRKCEVTAALVLHP